MGTRSDKRKLSLDSTQGIGVYASVSDVLMLSAAWQDMKPHIHDLYYCMRAQLYGKRKPKHELSKDNPIWKKVQDNADGTNLCFFFNRKIAQCYCKRYRNRSSDLYKDVRILEAHGFIDILESGRNTQTKSIYRFSEGWKTWKPESREEIRTGTNECTKG